MPRYYAQHDRSYDYPDKPVKPQEPQFVGFQQPHPPKFMVPSSTSQRPVRRIASLVKEGPQGVLGTLKLTSSFPIIVTCSAQIHLTFVL